MKFEIIAAFIVGALLPILETGRRGITLWATCVTCLILSFRTALRERSAS